MFIVFQYDMNKTLYHSKIPIFLMHISKESYAINFKIYNKSMLERDFKRKIENLKFIIS